MRSKPIRILILINILCVGVVLVFILSTERPESRSSTAETPPTSSEPSATDTSGESPEDRSNADVPTNSAPKPPSSALNEPGQDFDFSSYLKNGRVSIVYFYADWCPACQELSPLLADLNRNDPNTQVLFLDIGDWNTPIADRYRIKSVPFMRIYDKNGSLIAEGREARAWFQSQARP
jgi:thiol-disulfide isomerase/thioredoxin